MADTQQEHTEPPQDRRASESEQRRTESRGGNESMERSDTKAEERETTYQDSRYLDSRGGRSGSHSSKGSKGSRKGSKDSSSKEDADKKDETKKSESESKPEPAKETKESNQSKETKKPTQGGDNDDKTKQTKPVGTKSSPADKPASKPQPKKDNATRKTQQKSEKPSSEKDTTKQQKVEKKPKSETSDGSSEDSTVKHKKKKKLDSPRNGGSETNRSDSSQRQKEFFKLELQRLETGLKRESSKVIAPQKKPYTPFVFNTLEPYYNTYTTRYLIEMPDEVQHGHVSRKTAQGLTDPWLDLKMDRELPPVHLSKPVSRQVAILKKEKEIRDRKKRSAQIQSSQSRRGGSTRLPKFPIVQLETKDLATRQLFYSDVPALRHELKTKYSSSAKTKISEDYERTHQDFYRMELDKLDEVHPINRKNMTSAYFAYLQNTPGSKKAITECVRGLKSGKA